MSGVSVIMPSYNSAAFIEDSINSVLHQTHETLELIVVDDGSSDRTPEIIANMAKQDRRIQFIQRSTGSGGPATPRNDGLRVSKGDYLAFIDSDDVWHPRKLELQLKAVQQHALNFVSTLHTAFENTPPVQPHTAASNPKITLLSHARLIRKNTVVTSSALIDRSLFGSSLFNQAGEYVGVEDYLVWLELHQKPEIRSAILMLPLVYYRHRRHSLSSSKAVMAKKVFFLLSQYQYNGKQLGAVRYYYFLIYALSSIVARLRW